VDCIKEGGTNFLQHTSQYGLMAEFCEHDGKSLGAGGAGNFLDPLNNHVLLKFLHAALMSLNF
jgi:hypothetical protein